MAQVTLPFARISVPHGVPSDLCLTLSDVRTPFMNDLPTVSPWDNAIKCYNATVLTVLLARTYTTQYLNVLNDTGLPSSCVCVCVA